MSNMSNLKIETGSSPAEERFSITVTETGPYLVYGRPPLAEQFIMPDESNDSWYFQEGRHFDRIGTHGAMPLRSLPPQALLRRQP